MRLRGSFAITIKLDCGVIECSGAEAPRRLKPALRLDLRRRKLETEINKPALVPIDFAQVEIWHDQPDFIPDPVRHDGSLGIIQNDAILTIEPTLIYIDFGNDRVQSEG
jgi:hypothetical protein